jgi:predicted MFS family arabinose efflux permease
VERLDFRLLATSDGRGLSLFPPQQISSPKRTRGVPAPQPAKAHVTQGSSDPTGLSIRTERETSIFRATLSGFCAMLVGIGIGRFAYTPLVPALIGAGWFTPSQTYYLQAANFVGYLAGALLYRPLSTRMRNVVALRTMMLLASIALLACAAPLSFWWFTVWRFASGLSGGVMMVLATTVVLPHVPRQKAGLVSGVIFAGVALGIAGSGTAVPLLLHFGLTYTWIAFGVFSLVLTAIAWTGWPDHEPASPIQSFGDFPTKTDPGTRLILTSLYIEYALAAMALVPHMVFIVDFVARGLAYGVAIGSLYWVVFGVSAISGSLMAGWLGDRIGFHLALRIVFAIETAAILIPSLLQFPLAVLLSTVLAGAFVTGSSTVVLGRIQQLLPGGHRTNRAAWSVATVSFSLGQAVAAYVFSWLFAVTGSYATLFAWGAAALGLSLFIDAVANRRPRLST